MNHHESAMADFYDYEQESSPARRREAPDWGGDELFTTTPRRRRFDRPLRGDHLTDRFDRAARGDHGADRSDHNHRPDHNHRRETMEHPVQHALALAASEEAVPAVALLEP